MRFRKLERKSWISVAVLITLLHPGQSLLCEGTGEPRTNLDSGETRTVTVADSIRMTRLEDGPTFSPDGKRFVVVLRRGNLEQNTNEYSLMLWNTDDVLRTPQPEQLVVMSSSSNRPGITDVSWMQDNATIGFLGENPGDVQQLYSIDVRTHSIKKLTDHATSLMSFGLTPYGGRFAYIAEAPVESLLDGEARHNGIVLSTQKLDLLLAGKKSEAGPYAEKELFVSDASGIRRLNVSVKIGNDPDCIISPSGKYIVTEVNVASFPESWKEYSDPYLQEYTQAQPPPGQVSHLRKYVVIDTSTGEARTLLNSPIRWLTSVAWSPDSRSMVLAGVLLPLDGAADNERKKRRSTRFVVEVNVGTNEITKVADEDEASSQFNERIFGDVTRTTNWDPKTGYLVDILRDWQTSTELELIFQKDGAGWEKVKQSELSSKRPAVVLDQDLNTPPKLFAIDTTTGKRVLLLDLNPQFAELKFAKVEAVQWKGSDGHLANGDLYYPVDYLKGTRYPLVIQTHGWSPHDFWIDGPATTAYAAQALAAKGIMVLQADEIMYGSDWDTMREINREVSTWEVAIDDLNERGLIDRNRVGIIGWSRPGAFTEFALTREKYKFAAASVADGGAPTVGNFLLAANTSPEIAVAIQKLYGGLPFGDGMKSWVELCPEFHLDRMRTPLRLLATAPGMLAGQWSWFTSLLVLGKPVEMVYLPEGDHVLQKPWERLVSQQGNVDWFAFWLTGEEDSDSAKAKQYARWRELRKQQDASEATQKPH